LQEDPLATDFDLVEDSSGPLDAFGSPDTAASEAAAVLPTRPQAHAISPRLQGPQNMKDLNLTGARQLGQANSYPIHLETGFGQLCGLSRAVGTTKGNEL